MKLTSKSEYSILALIYIARNQDQGFIKAKDICNYYHISKKYLELLFNILKNNRIIKTKRGPSGGYKLAQQPEDVKLANIIRIMDGALASTESVSEYFYSDTPLSKEKTVLGIFRQIRDYAANILEKTSIKDLL